MSITGHPIQLLDHRMSGPTVARYATYAEAQRAVDLLAEDNFPVEHTWIVGRDLRQVEEVTGRLTLPRATAAGVAGGAWIGLLVGALLALVAPVGANWIVALLIGVGLGAIFGAVGGAAGFALMHGRHDFTSNTAIVGGYYEVVCTAAHAADAQDRLTRLEGEAT